MMLGDREKWLDRPVDQRRDHVLGPADAEITLVEHGGYSCPSCRAANEVIAGLRDEFGDRLRYVFRHRPLEDNDMARRAAILAERAESHEQFWAMHVELMTRSSDLTEEDLQRASAILNESEDVRESVEQSADRARPGEQRHRGAHASGVLVTPTFFIDGRRYEGPWDQHALSDAMRRTPGHRARLATLDFLRWGPSAGLLLLLATVLALAMTNSPWRPQFAAFWERSFGFRLNGSGFEMPLQDWINDGLLTVFFLVVGLEIKRELTVGGVVHFRCRHGSGVETMNMSIQHCEEAAWWVRGHGLWVGRCPACRRG